MAITPPAAARAIGLSPAGAPLFDRFTGGPGDLSGIPDIGLQLLKTLRVVIAVERHRRRPREHRQRQLQVGHVIAQVLRPCRTFAP